MNEATLEKMRKMNLFGMHRVFKASLESGKKDKCTTNEMISNLVQSEWDDRQNRGIERLVKNAKFRYKASMEELNYKVDRNIDKNQIMRLGVHLFLCYRVCGLRQNRFQ